MITSQLYSNEVVEFQTVTLTNSATTILLWYRFPDELRKKGHIGKVFEVSIRSTLHPQFIPKPYGGSSPILYTPGTHINSDDDVTIMRDIYFDFDELLSIFEGFCFCGKDLIAPQKCCVIDDVICFCHGRHYGCIGYSCNPIIDDYAVTTIITDDLMVFYSSQSLQKYESFKEKVKESMND